MVQLLQINPSVTSIGEREYLVGNAVQPVRQLPAQPDAFAVKKLEAELNEHRYSLEKKVEQRTGQLVKRITLLESCNATLSDKLAKARSEIAALQKQLTNAQSGMETGDLACIEPGNPTLHCGASFPAINSPQPS